MNILSKPIAEYDWPAVNVADVMDETDPKRALVSACVLDCHWAPKLLEKAALLEGVAESPIETILGAHILAAMEGLRLCSQSQLSDMERGHMYLVPQFKFDRYRFDFAFMAAGEDRPLLVVECDGKDFHSSQKQMARDRARDDHMRGLGVPVRRFWGTLIHRNPKLCVFRLHWDLDGLLMPEGC